MKHPPDKNGKAVGLEESNGQTEEQKNELHNQARRQPLTVASAIETYYKNRSKKGKPYREPDPTRSYVWKGGWCVTLCDASGETITWIIRATSPEEIFEEWRSKNACPETGTGTRAVHRWLLKAANACRVWRIPPGEAFDFIRDGSANCGRYVEAREINEAISEAYGSAWSGKKSSHKPKEDEVKYNPEKLSRIANRIDFDITPEWLEERSAVTIRDLTPAGFLHALYEPGERVWIGTIKNARRGTTYQHDGDTQNFAALDHLREGNEGVWFLSNPVTGEAVEGVGTVNQWFPKGESWRSEENVTSWRYLLIESDEAPERLWLRMLVQAPLAISAIYASGSRSIHALVRVDKPSKGEWDQFKDSIKKELITIGADPNSLSAVRLTRLPGCMRNEPGKTGLQRLLYLNPQPTNTPIFKLEPRSK